MRSRRSIAPATVLLAMLIAVSPTQTTSAAPAPPAAVTAADHPWDAGDKIDVRITLSPDDVKDADPPAVTGYKIQVAPDVTGPFPEVDFVATPDEAYRDGAVLHTIEKLERNKPYFIRVAAVGPDGSVSEPVILPDPVRPTRQWFDGGRVWLAVMTAVLCGSVLLYIGLARSGRPLRVRKIAGLEAVDEAVGRATEMGRSVMFIPGIQDMNDIQTIAGITILARVARTAAEYNARVEVPTSRSLVMTAARETVQASFLAAGRPDAFNQDDIYYVTDEQFGYVAYLGGAMVREKPAACFYMGSFFAESLILAETGNSIGAIQVAGTAQPAQLPFFVAACDYTLIGEEFFAASAYLSGEPDQLGSLKGQDVGKIVVAAFLVIGCGVATYAALGMIFEGWPGTELATATVHYIKDTVLR